MNMAKTVPGFVPRVVHWVSPGRNGEVFPYWAYINAAIIVDVVQPTEFFYHHVNGNLPAGKWWALARPFLKLSPGPPIEHVYNNPVDLLAHRADVMRLLALERHGGVYMDTDVLPLRSFSQLLMFNNSFLIGLQGSDRAANAVMLASQRSRFVLRWLDAYHNFTDSDWDGHSVRLPFRLAENFPGEALLLPRTAWFTPGPDDDPGYELFDRHLKDHDPVMPVSEGPFAYHLWHQITRRHLDKVTGPAWFDAHNSTLYARTVRGLASSDCPHLAAALTSALNEPVG